MIKLEYADKIHKQEDRSKAKMFSQLDHSAFGSMSKIAVLHSRYNYWQAQYRAYLGNKCSSEYERKTNLKGIDMCRRSAQQALNELKQYRK